jgi:hypothetical protein
MRLPTAPLPLLNGFRNQVRCILETAVGLLVKQMRLHPHGNFDTGRISPPIFPD